MADLGFLPVLFGDCSTTHSARRSGQRPPGRRPSTPVVDVLVRRFLTPIGHPQRRLGAFPGGGHGPPRPAHPADPADPGGGRPGQRPGPDGGLHPHQVPGQGPDQAAQRPGHPAVELHGNVAQNARARNMKLFQSGEVETLVATDIAARGIHVDDIELVVHADPPVEHKAYLHRSGRTARAGKAGTVITLMTDDQARDVRSLTKAAGVRPPQLGWTLWPTRSWRSWLPASGCAAARGRSPPLRPRRRSATRRPVARVGAVRPPRVRRSGPNPPPIAAEPPAQPGLGHRVDLGRRPRPQRGPLQLAVPPRPTLLHHVRTQLSPGSAGF